MKLDEYPDILHIGKGLCYDYLRSGKIKSFTFGSPYKIPKEAVIEYIKTQGYTIEPLNVIN